MVFRTGNVSNWTKFVWELGRLMLYGGPHTTTVPARVLVGTISLLLRTTYCPCTSIHKLVAYFYAAPENAPGWRCVCTAHGCKLQQSFGAEQQQQEYTHTYIHSSFLDIYKLYLRVFLSTLTCNKISNYKLSLELFFFPIT